MAVSEDRDCRQVPPQRRLELRRRPPALHSLVHEQDANASQLDAAGTGEAGERRPVRVAADRGHRRQPLELRQDVGAPDVARVEDVVDACEDARHRGVKDAVRVGDEPHT
ncbi:MAG TPA: hypothetical protein VE911_08375 [Candidatus Nitrosopolaris sp.]|nr:hypothetical protein [Candidatus Nitrosopolaris sp.]